MGVVKKLWLLFFLLFFFVSESLCADLSHSIVFDKASTTELLINSKTIDGFSAVNVIGSVGLSELNSPRGRFTSLSIEGYSKNYGTEGRPHLPVLTKLIEIPYGASVKIEMKSYDTEDISLAKEGDGTKLGPMQPSISKNLPTDKAKFFYKSSAYTIDAFNTDPLVIFENIGTTRGTRIGRLKISPLRYNPVQNSVRIVNNIKFDVRFENAETANIDRLKKRNNSPVFKRSLNSIEQLAETSATRKGEIIADASWPLTYVIVAHENFRDNDDLNDFIRWKRQSGFNIIDVYTGDSAVGSTRDSIKAYLANLYNNSSTVPSYALLIGDVDKIPSWDGTTGGHVTDLYYFTYDDDSDDGDSDHMPDVYYGRFPADDDEDLAAIISKTLQYEKFEFTMETEPDYLDDYMFIAGADSENAPIYGNAQVNYAVAEYFPTVCEYLYIENRSDIADAIRDNFNAGMGFVNYTGHCTESGWYNDNSDSYDFDSSDISGLLNKNKYGFVIGNCCLSNNFDEDDCFGENIVTKKNGGAIGYIGASNDSYWDEDFYWSVGEPVLPFEVATASEHTTLNTEYGAYDGLFHEGQEHSNWYISAGEIIYAGNLAVTNAGSFYDKYYWEIYHLMGDPSLIPYLEVPGETDQDAILIEPNASMDGCTISNIEENSYVALSQAGILLDSDYSGENTSVSLDLAAVDLENGAGTIVITKQNRRPVILAVDMRTVSKTSGDVDEVDESCGEGGGSCFIGTMFKTL